jgi:putative membrane protein
MGGADVIPGVSGGTVAFIMGIYEELLFSLGSFDLEAFHMLRKFQFASFWKKVNGSFLVTLLAGIMTSILSLARLMTYLLDTYPIHIWSFFFGLILVSTPLILRDIKKWTPMTAVWFAVGIVVAYLITVLSPTETPTTWWFIIFSGSLAICAMILPGISGAFILLLIGKYEYMINALIHADLGTVALFAFGCVVGLLSFARFLSWILTHYRFPTIAVLAGFMLGSLNKVWPWKEVTAFRLDSHGNQVPAFDKSVLPWDYFTKTGKDPLVFQAILMVALGVLIVVVIEKVAVRLKTKA